MLARRGAGIGGIDDLAPPLQADLPEHRLGDRLAYPGDLIVEGIEREQRLAPIGRSEQRGLIAIAVVPADQLGERREPACPAGMRTPLARFSLHTILPSLRSRSH